MSEFNALPVELQLLIVDAVPVNERSGRATLALASPRLLAASRELPSCQGLEMSLASTTCSGVRSTSSYF